MDKAKYSESKLESYYWVTGNIESTIMESMSQVFILDGKSNDDIENVSFESAKVEFKKYIENIENFYQQYQDDLDLAIVLGDEETINEKAPEDFHQHYKVIDTNHLYDYNKDQWIKHRIHLIRWYVGSMDDTIEAITNEDFNIDREDLPNDDLKDHYDEFIYYIQQIKDTTIKFIKDVNKIADNYEIADEKIIR